MGDITSPDIKTQLAELSRFGPKKSAEAPKKEAKPSLDLVYAQVKDVLVHSGFSYGGKVSGENESWFSFVNNNPSFAKEVWDDLAEREERAVEDDQDFPKEFLDAYKVCVDIPPTLLPSFLRLLDQQFADIPFVAKVAKPKVLRRENFPKLVLYIRGAKMNEVLDFAIALGRASKHQLGESSSKLIMAKEVEPGSGVFLTQGNFTVKQRAGELGRMEKYYGEDGALFKETEARFRDYFTRRRNQFLIEESLYEYVGFPKVSERLTALQADAFRGLPDKVKRGVRDHNVTVGEYFAPRHEVLKELTEALDSRSQELLDNPRFAKDYQQAVRSASAVYMLYILCHPFSDGNGQSCANMISSLLYEGGYQKVYLTAFLDGLKLRSKAFAEIETTESPTKDTRFWRKATEEMELKPGEESGQEKQKAREAQNYAAEFLGLATKKLAWAEILGYVNSGKLPDFSRLEARGTDKTTVAVLRSLLTRTEEINKFLLKALSDSPTGAKELDFGDLSQAAERGESLLKK